MAAKMFILVFSIIWLMIGYFLNSLGLRACVFYEEGLLSAIGFLFRLIQTYGI
jgi:hypothetical protein